MSEGFNLPALSFERLQKVIQAYGRNDKAKTKEELSNSTGINAISISKSNAFLADCGFITSGNTKTPTETGKQLAREIQFENEQEVCGIWSAALTQNETLMDALGRLEVGGPMDIKDFVGHLVYSSQRSETKDNRSGAGCVKDAMVLSAIFSEAEGKVSLVPSGSKAGFVVLEEEPSVADKKPVKSKPAKNTPVVQEIGSFAPPQVAINIQLQIPEMDDPTKYDALFASMKRNLFPDKS